MKRVRTTILLLSTLGLLAVPATALAGSFTAKLQIGSHTPAVGYQPLTVTATRGGTKLAGSVYYRFLYGGQVVSKQSGGKFSHGVYRDKLKWPAEAVGHTITLQVVVTTRYGTDYLNWWIKVRK